MNTERFSAVSNAAQLRALAVIPARFASSRLPGKPLRLINQRPLILHTVNRAREAQTIEDVIVATDDKRIFEVCLTENVRAMMTGEHPSGTDRIAEVVTNLAEHERYDVIVNVQGDEPLIHPATIDSAVMALIENPKASVATTCERINEVVDVLSPDVVKVVCDEHGRALYFSRSVIPYPREVVRRYGSLEAAFKHDTQLINLYRKHTGLYAYRREALLEYVRLAPSSLEQTESLEQLRLLQHGWSIIVVESPHTSIGVDTETDLERVEEIVKDFNLVR